MVAARSTSGLIGGAASGAAGRVACGLILETVSSSPGRGWCRLPLRRGEEERLVTTSQARRLALSLPGVDERRGGARASYGVGGRRFAARAREPRSLLLRLTAREQRVLTQVRPAEFAAEPRLPRGWTRVHLGRVDAWLFEELVVAAWRRVARPREAAAWDAARAAVALPQRGGRGRP